MIHVAALLANGSTTVTTVATSAAHKSSGSILDPIAKPIAWLLAEIYAVIPNYGVAILILSVIWMALISPLTLKSTRSMLAMQKLQPELKKLQEKHKNDKQAFAQAQMELFREHGVSPFGACLPMLLPLPIFFALFRVIDGLSHMTNGVPTPKYIPASTKMYQNIVAAGGQIKAFGMNLNQTALSHHSSFAAALPYWILLLLMGLTSYFQSAMMMNRNQANYAANPQMATQMRLMKFLPLVFVVFCIRFPAGVILYYTMSNICRIVQQDAMYRFDPKVKALVAKEVTEVESLTDRIDEEDAPPPSGQSGPSKSPRPKPAPRGSAGRSGSPPPAAADSQANGSGDGTTPKPDAKTGGRAWFRSLLESAEQEQRARGAGKAAGSAGAAGAAAAKGASKPAPSGGKGRPAGGNGSTGSSRAGGTPASGNGSGSTSKGRSQPSKSRTNRKRRGR
jgi:YidC/Oxa1 family membrane protein insertase